MFKPVLWGAVALGIVLGAALCAAEPASAGDAPAAADGKITMNAKDLYNGFEARKVVLDKDGAKLVLDKRVFEFGKEHEGRVVTDVIDLGPADGVVGQDATVKSVDLEFSAEVPEGAAVEVETRSGASFFDQSGWSEWKKLNGLKGTVGDLKGRYFQVKTTLKAPAADKLPALTGLTLKPAVVAPPTIFKGSVAVAESKIQKIVRSPVEFQYERPDQAKLAKFRKDNDLDAVVKDGKDDFEKLVKLMDWVGACKNNRTEKRESAGGFYQWDIEKVFDLREIEKDGKKVKAPTIFGHCMSYAEVMVTAATAMGYVGSRHMAKVGFREASHEVCDIWVPSMGKWVYFDPSLTSYYLDKDTKEKLNLIEMHKVIADKFLKGEDMNWFIVRSESKDAAQKKRVREVGGKAVIDCRLGPWKYGEAMPADYDWGWYHGYLAAGFVQMTPRNDFNSHPEANPKRFGSLPGYSDYPFWVDDKTPPKKGVNNWFTRLRDFYWTLDQASVKLVRTGDAEITVELGNSMPFFDHYAIDINNNINGNRSSGIRAKIKGSPYPWKLTPGQNELSVAPVDEFGKVGLASSVTLKLQ